MGLGGAPSRPAANGAPACAPCAPCAQVDQGAASGETVEVACVWGCTSAGTAVGLPPHAGATAGGPTPGHMHPSCGPPNTVDVLLVVPMYKPPAGVTAPELVLVGNVPQLGSWDAGAGAKLTRGPASAAVHGPAGSTLQGEDSWTARVRLPMGRLIEAK